MERVEEERGQLSVIKEEEPLGCGESLGVVTRRRKSPDNSQVSEKQDHKSKSS